MLFIGANLLIVFAALTSLFAFLKGGTPERIGAAIVMANTLAYMVSEALLHNQLVNLGIDGLTALVLLAVAVRYASFWQGAVMLLYAMQFGLHAVYFVLERPRDNFHVIVNNGIFYAVCACLAAGTALAWRRRGQAATN